MILTWMKFWRPSMHTTDPQDPTESFKESESLGYEVTDVNVNGIVVFLASLFAFVGVFFIFCFGMGKVINTAILKSDGPPNKWNQIGTRPSGKRQDLTSKAGMEQQQLNKRGRASPPLGCKPTMAILRSRKCTPEKIFCSTTTAGLIGRAVRCAS